MNLSSNVETQGSSKLKQVTALMEAKPKHGLPPLPQALEILPRGRVTDRHDPLRLGSRLCSLTQSEYRLKPEVDSSRLRDDLKTVVRDRGSCLSVTDHLVTDHLKTPKGLQWKLE